MMKPKNVALLSFILLIAFLASGCVQKDPEQEAVEETQVVEVSTQKSEITELPEETAEPTTSPTETFIPTPSPTTSIEMIDYYYSEFEDFFDWKISTKDDLGDYAITVFENGLSFDLSKEDFLIVYPNVYGINSVIELGFDLVDDSDDLNYQIICRASEAGEYVFEFNSSGRVKLLRSDIQAGNSETIISNTFDVNLFNDDSNQVIVVCDEINLTMQINEILVIDAIDDELSEGFVGIGFNNLSDGAYKIRLNYFFVSAP